VIGNDGTVLASTIDSEVGKKLEEETLAIMRAHRPTPDAINKGFGYEVGVQSPIHFYTVLRTNADETVIGYIVNRVEAHELDKVLSGEMQISFGGLPGNIMRGATAETILIDRENGLLLTSSRFIANAPGKIRDAVLPVEECLTSGYEASGAWKDYRGIPVYGAAMCPRDTFFILVSKIDVTEVEEGFVAMRRATEVIASIIALFTIFAHAWLHTILEKRMEIECETRKNIPKK
jgi:methyl-accepting chemotaxis protein